MTDSKIQVPPSAPQIVNEAKKWACDTHDQFNPTTLSRCRKANKIEMDDSVREQCLNRALQFQQQLSVYESKEHPFTERTFRMGSSTADRPEVWLSSVKNSDHTISYWLQFPVLDVHLKMAFCSLTGRPLNLENFDAVEKAYPALYKQCKAQLAGETVACEQVDPVFMEVVVKSLFLQGYDAQEKK